MDDLGRVRLVTERYTELQGLRVAFAGVIWAAFGTSLLPQRDVTSLELLVTVFGALAVYLPGNWALRRYYAARFGRIVIPGSRSKAWFFPAVVVVTLAEKMGGGHLGGAFVVASAGALWITIRDWPARGYYVLGFIAGALAAAAQFTSLPGDGAPQALGCAILGLSYIPVGLLDHRLLTSVMRTPNHYQGLLKQ